MGTAAATLIGLMFVAASIGAGLFTDEHTVGEPSSVRIMKAAAAAVGTPWLWTLTYGHHDDRTPTHS